MRASHESAERDAWMSTNVARLDQLHSRAPVRRRGSLFPWFVVSAALVASIWVMTKYPSVFALF